MFFELIKNTGIVQEINTLTIQLRSYGMFSALLDLASLKSGERSLLKNNNNAERAAWHDGYVEALRDVFYFSDLVSLREGVVRDKPAMDYGALNKLLSNNEITKEEYDTIVKSRNW